jgi:hypothetical protein
MIEELRIVGYVALGLLILYAGLRFIAERAIKRLVKTELDTVIVSDEFKPKGRFE